MEPSAQTPKPQNPKTPINDYLNFKNGGVNQTIDWTKRLSAVEIVETVLSYGKNYAKKST